MQHNHFNEETKQPSTKTNELRQKFSQASPLFSSIYWKIKCAEEGFKAALNYIKSFSRELSAQQFYLSCWAVI